MPGITAGPHLARKHLMRTQNKDERESKNVEQYNAIIEDLQLGKILNKEHGKTLMGAPMQKEWEPRGPQCPE